MKIALAVVVAVVVIGGGYFIFKNKAQAPVQNPAATETRTSAPLETTKPVTTGNGLEQPAVTVTYTDAGFAPKTVDVPPGTTITFLNKSSHGMWVASDVHPSHTKYDGTTLQQHCATQTSFDECKPESTGTSFSFTFDKAGSFTYHNHVRAGDVGLVVVK